MLRFHLVRTFPPKTTHQPVHWRKVCFRFQNQRWYATTSINLKICDFNDDLYTIISLPVCNVHAYALRQVYQCTPLIRIDQSRIWLWAVGYTLYIAPVTAYVMVWSVHVHRRVRWSYGPVSSVWRSCKWIPLRRPRLRRMQGQYFVCWYQLYRQWLIFISWPYTNGRAYAVHCSSLRLSVVCDVMYCG